MKSCKGKNIIKPYEGCYTDGPKNRVYKQVNKIHKKIRHFFNKLIKKEILR